MDIVIVLVGVVIISVLGTLLWQVGKAMER